MAGLDAELARQRRAGVAGGRPALRACAAHGAAAYPARTARRLGRGRPGHQDAAVPAPPAPPLSGPRW